MAVGLIKGKGFRVRNNGEFEITEFELAGSNYIIMITNWKFISRTSEEWLFVHWIELEFKKVAFCGGARREPTTNSH